jgi:predicted AAA+ superfamily ATPase
MATSPGGREFYGTLLEQFVALELSKQQAWTNTEYEIFHFRDIDSPEVDLPIETHDGHLIAIEVKTTGTPTSKHWANLLAFRERFHDRQVMGVLFHTGTAATRSEGLHILPITALWSH